MTIATDLTPHEKALLKKAIIEYAAKISGGEKTDPETRMILRELATAAHKIGIDV